MSAQPQFCNETLIQEREDRRAQVFDRRLGLCRLVAFEVGRCSVGLGGTPGHGIAAQGD